MKTISSIRSAAANFISTSTTHGPRTGKETTAAYNSLLDATQPNTIDPLDDPYFHALDAGVGYRRSVLLARTLRVAQPLMYASTVDPHTIAHLLGAAGNDMEHAMPYAFIDGPRRMRTETRHELERLIDKYKLLGLAGQKDPDPAERIAFVIDRIPVRSIGAATSRFVTITRSHFGQQFPDILS